MKNLEVAVVGCGEVANGHLSAWKKISNAKVVAVSDLNLDLAKATGRNASRRRPVSAFPVRRFPGRRSRRAHPRAARRRAWAIRR